MKKVASILMKGYFEAVNATNAANADASLRDYFAGLAMQAMLSNGTVHVDVINASAIEYLAENSYWIASALLETRAKLTGE